MKIIQTKLDKFQKIYASELTTIIFFIASVEIYFLVMVFLGGQTR